MSKKEDSKQLDITDVEYNQVKELKLWNSKHEFEVVSETRKRFFELLLYRRTGCYWGQVPNMPGISEQDIINYNSGSTWESGGTGSNWNHRWNYVLKAYLMWKRYIEGVSNIKSPITFATIEAMVAEFTSGNATISLLATDPDNASNVRIQQEYLRNWEQTQDISYSKLKSFREAAIYGTSHLYNPYVRRSHMKEIILQDDAAVKYLKELRASKDEADHKKATDLQAQLDREKPITKEVEIIDWDDPMIVPVNIFEVFPDNHASCLQGPYRAANDLDWRRVYGLKQLLAEFENSNDPYVIKSNLKKVRPTDTVNQSYGLGEIFFRVPSDLLTTKGKVEVHHYYNKYNDTYLVIANDILIREGPLPGNHGEIPFSKCTLVDFGDQYYGVGISDQLETITSADETILNMHFESEKIVENPPLLVDKQTFEDIDQQYNRLEPGLKLSGIGDIGPNKIRWMEPPHLDTGGMVALRAQFSQDGTKASGVNDLAYSVQSGPNEAVRNNMQAMESTFKIIKARTKNWSYGYKNSIRQVLALCKQYLPDKFEDEDYNLITHDIQFEEGEEGVLMAKDTPGTYYTPLKRKYFEDDDDSEVIVDVDSMLPISANMKVTRSEQALQVLQFVVNPQIMQDPIARKILKDYFQQHGYDSTMMDLFNDDDKGEEDRMLAEEQNAAILDGKDVPSIPGVSDTHLLAHAALIFKIQGEILFMQADGNAKISEYNHKVEQYNRLLAHYQGDAEGRKQLLSDTATAKPKDQKGTGPDVLNNQMAAQAMGQGAMAPMNPMMSAGPMMAGGAPGMPPGMPAPQPGQAPPPM